MKIVVNLLLAICSSCLLVAQREIAFIADTQKPLELERVMKKNEHNERATDLLFSFIARRQPAALFLLGDIVGKGSSQESWKKIDTFLTALKQNEISYHAIQGNHEYMFNAKKDKANFRQRFGSFEDNINVQCIDSLAIIMVNSNFSRLSAGETHAMLARYALAMDSLQKLTYIESIIVCTHHAPYTNSKVVEPSEKVQQLIVPKYLSTPKANLFISGHAHLMEIFRQSGKYFCVIGGGGGIRQDARVGERQRYSDLSANITHYRYFYCTVQLQHNVLHVSVHGINDGEREERSEEILSIRQHKESESKIDCDETEK